MRFRPCVIQLGLVVDSFAKIYHGRVSQGHSISCLEDLPISLSDIIIIRNLSKYMKKN